MHHAGAPSSSGSLPTSATSTGFSSAHTPRASALTVHGRGSVHGPPQSVLLSCAGQGGVTAWSSLRSGQKLRCLPSDESDCTSAEANHQGLGQVQPLWRTGWRFLKKLKIELPYDPAIPLLGIYLEKTIIQKGTCTPMFIIALFTIARTWKQPKCPTDEWIKKMWYIHKWNTT